MSALSQAAKISLEIYDLKNKIQEIPQALRQGEAEYAEFKKQHEQKSQLLEQAQLAKRKLSSELTQELEGLQGKETRLNGIKTQKEFQAVSREISMAKLANRERETQIQILDAQIHGLNSEIEPLASTLSELGARLSQERESITQSLNDLETQLSSITQAIDEQLAILSPELRERYHRIASIRQPPAALVVSGTCQECFISLPPQMYVQLQRQPDEVFSCPSCQRILYRDS